MNKWVTLKVAEWLPDQPAFENTGATVAKGCIAGTSSYLPIGQLEDLTGALGTTIDDYVRGSTSIKDSSNITHVYAGDAGKLYELSATAWDDISAAGNAYSGTATDNIWSFCSFGADRLIANNYNNKPQLIVPGNDAIFLPGSPPRTKYCAQIKDWLVFANINDGAAKPNHVKWSGYNNSEFWERDVALQADEQELYEGGQITGLRESYGQGVILQENAVHLMTYAGPPVTWSFKRIANALGTKTPGSVVGHRERVWWIGESDIWEYSLAGIKPIASEKVARTFFDDFDASARSRVSGAVDPIRNIVAWAYPGAGHIGGRPNRILFYAYNVGRWSLLENVSLDVLAQFLSVGYTLDGLDALSSSIDTLTASLDSDVYKGGQLSLSAIKPEALQIFSGTPYPAIVETAELRVAPGRVTEITNTRPLHEGGTPSISICTRNLQNEPVLVSAPKKTNSVGECNVRSSKRFTRARLYLSGNWSHAIGVDLYVREGGVR